MGLPVGNDTKRASRDVYRLGKPPAELSRKEAIQKFVTSSRQIGTHQEF